MGKKYHRFLQKNRDKGIPRLILYLCIANAVLFLYTYFTSDARVYDVLRFDYYYITRGQVWRLFTWLFTSCVDSGYRLYSIIFYVLFNHWLGSVLEGTWGTLRLNFYYFGGWLLTVIGAMILGAFGIPVMVTAYYLELSLMLAVATLIPNERIMLFGIIPLKLRWLAFLDLALVILGILRVALAVPNVLLWQMILIVATTPVVSFLNYALNFGKDVGRLFHSNYSYKQIKRHREFKKAANPNPGWAGNYRGKNGEKPYRHKCSVCGRTDADHPNLEFRYCSRCKGYYCYCIEHINNHTHIE
ncbi:MAG: hypothetical protein IKM59_02175 [Oscillospiraceae bacterium]|nr:hypothetical protein [Oscillospiraceae bacterium]